MPAKKTTSKAEALSLVATEPRYANSPIVFNFEEKDPMKLALSFQERFGVKIENGDLMVYKTPDGSLKPYVTAQGCGKIAMAQKISTEPKIIEMKRNHPYFVTVQCTARRGGVEAVEIATCDSTEPGKDNKPFNQILAMAITRARNRAVKFLSSGPGVFEEFAESDPEHKAIDITELTKGVQIEQKLQKCPECGMQGWSTLEKRCKECGITYEQILAKKEVAKSD